MSNSTFFLTPTDIPHNIPLFNLLPSIIGYLHLIVSLSLPFTLTFLLFNQTIVLCSRFSYILASTYILYFNLLLFSFLLVSELTSYNSLYFTFKSFVSIIYYVVHRRHITSILSSYVIILQR